MKMKMKQEKTFRVPRARVHLAHQAMKDEILKALEPVLFGLPTEREAVKEQLECEFAKVVNKPFACAVHSGTVGLFVALRAIGVGPGDEVITVGNSDISTTAAIRHCGATPVLCDVQEEDYTINPELVERLITPRTKALLPVDLYGHPADVRTLRTIADQHGLRIVEDAALATGAEDYGHPVGTYADIAVFSFAPFKPLGSVGNGGMLVTDDPRLAERMQLLVSYGHDLDHRGIPPGHQRHVAEGYNVPLDPLQAALLRVKLPYLPQWTKARRDVAAAYAAGLEGSGVQLPCFRPESRPTFRCFTVCVPHRQQVYEALRQAGIEVVLHYVPPPYRQPVYGGRLPGADSLPVTERLAETLLCLPVSPELTQEEVEHVVQTLRALTTNPPGPIG